MAYRFTNDLDDNEKLEVPRLLGHDNTQLIAIAQQRAICAELDENPKLLKNMDRLFEHIGLINSAVTSLTQNEEIGVSTGDEFDCRLSGLKEAIKAQELDFELVQNVKNIRANPELLYTSLHNIIKNAAEIQKRTNPSEKVTLIIEPNYEMPSDALFYPAGAFKHKDFIAFRIHDSGTGFPKSRGLSTYLTIRPPNGNHGFGLYFTGLAARVMESPLDIKSKPGDTNVTIYLPVYPE